VAGIGAALVAGDDVKVLRQDIYDFALPFVAPLHTNHHDVR
jgi:hypothetical protein